MGRHNQLLDLWPDLQAGGPVAVHEARKLARKAEAELRAWDAPKRDRRAWRELRRAVAGVRDADAAREHLRAGLAESGAGRRTLAAFDRASAEARAAAWVAIQLPEPPPEVRRPRRWKARTRERLARDERRVQRLAGAALTGDDPETWHDWRKALKRYRHTLELLHKPPKALLDLLQALGRLQDAQVAQATIADSPDLPRRYRRPLAAREQAAALDAMQAARTAWAALTDERERAKKDE